jgi:hypothetical protein
MRERWRKVRRAPGYKVSSEGRVRSVGRTLADGRPAGGVLLEPVPDEHGRMHVELRGERVAVATLVLEAFDRPRPYGLEACHGELGTDSDALVNLRWDTHLENMRDKRRKAKPETERETYQSVVGTPVTGDVQ